MTPPTPPRQEWITRLEAIVTARNVAKRMGYAISVHGSLVKDVDLVAVPWVEDGDGVSLGTARELVAAVAEALNWIYGPVEERPHGRLGWALKPHTRAPKGRGTDAWYIDLSVMPRRRKRKPASHPAPKTMRKPPLP